jgi:hypothetical protein
MIKERDFQNLEKYILNITILEDKIIKSKDIIQ